MPQVIVNSDRLTEGLRCCKGFGFYSVSLNMIGFTFRKNCSGCFVEKYCWKEREKLGGPIEWMLS